MKQIVGLVSISLRDDRNVVSKISRREHANQAIFSQNIR